MTNTTLPTTEELRARARAGLERIGVTLQEGTDFQARTPLTGEDLFGLTAATATDTEEALAATSEAFLAWRTDARPGAAAQLVTRLGRAAAASTRTTSPTWSPSRSARSPPRPSARSRR